MRHNYIHNNNLPDTQHSTNKTANKGTMNSNYSASVVTVLSLMRVDGGEIPFPLVGTSGGANTSPPLALFYIA